MGNIDDPMYNRWNMDYTDPSFIETWTQCYMPTAMQVASYMGGIIFWNILFRIMTQTVYMPLYICHIISTVIGIMTLQFVSGSLAVIALFLFAVFTYTGIIIAKKFNCNNCVKIIIPLTLIPILFVEITSDMHDEEWIKVRGIFMIATMKAIAIAAEYDPERNKLLSYFGYIFCPANCVIGPFASFNEYIKVFSNIGYKKYYISKLIINAGFAFTFSIISNCLFHSIISDQANHFVAAYRNATSFRFSHYFMSFLSQTTMVAAGFGNTDAIRHGFFGYAVTNPFNVENARSMRQVVVAWNLPMHVWLKCYIYRSQIMTRSPFIALLMTYLFSCLLHGFNVKVSFVLMSIALYSNVEHKIRIYAARKYNSCILAKSCKPNCQHIYKNTIGVWVFNICFRILTAYMLYYIGCVFDSTIPSDSIYENVGDALYHWRDFNFFGHAIIIYAYFVYSLL